MKRILIILAIIPLFANAQSKKENVSKPPLIESITTDTVKGKFKQVLFSYDASNRVVGITNKKFTISTGSDKKIKLVEAITRKQVFEYQSDAIQPFARINRVYGYDEKDKYWILGFVEQQYFLYNNGQRVGDSTLYFDNKDEKKDWDWKTVEPKIRIAKLDQTNKRIYHELVLARPYSAPNIYKNQFKLYPTSNIRYEAEEHRYGGRGRDGTYYTFSSFDSKLNPLKLLNIASTLADEKISFYSGEEGNREISWYFVNQNNIVDYFVTDDELSSDFNDIINLRYSYNQYDLPIHVKVLIKHRWYDGEHLKKKYQKNFTFRYKK